MLQPHCRLRLLPPPNNQPLSGRPARAQQRLFEWREQTRKSVERPV